MAKVNRLPYTDIIDELDIGSVIYPKYLTADMILRYVRAMQNTIGSNVETLYHILDNQAEALEFNIRDDSPVCGDPSGRSETERQSPCMLSGPSRDCKHPQRTGYHPDRRQRDHRNKHTKDSGISAISLRNKVLEMNYRIILYITGWVFNLQAIFMVLPCITALIYQEEDDL